MACAGVESEGSADNVLLEAWNHNHDVNVIGVCCGCAPRPLRVAALLLGEGGCEFAVGADLPVVEGAAGRLGELE